MTADKQAITLRLDREQYDWLRTAAFQARITQVGVIDALIDLARNGEDGTLILAQRALFDRFKGAWFTMDDAASVIRQEWLGDRPNLWGELHALGYVYPAPARTGPRQGLWKLNLNSVLSTRWTP